MILQRIFGCSSAVLDLDGISENTALGLETYEHRGKDRRSAELLIGLMIKQSLKNGAIAMNIFSDGIDQCLRSLQYIPVGTAEEVASKEMLPAPAALIEPALTFVRRLASIKGYSGSGTLMYRLDNRLANARVETPNQSEVRIYFGASRPEMKNRQR